jgi:DNA-binding NarL/FixJ family response regulator
MSERLRIAIVDASAQVRDAIASLIDEQAEVVARVGSLRELSGLQGADADVVIAEFGACSGARRADLEQIRRRCPHMRFILTTVEEEQEYEDAAASLSADGWVPKSRLGRDLAEVLRRIT